MHKKIMLLFWLLGSTLLYGCAACMLTTPKTDVSIQLHFDQEHLSNIHYQWRFSMPYTAELLTQYDTNRNGIFDAQEQQEILSQTLSYAKPKEMLTTITYAAADANAQELALTSRYSGFAISFKEGHLLITYEGATDLKVEKGGMLSFAFEDSEGLFDFRVLTLDTGKSPFPTQTNTYLFTGAVAFEEPKAAASAHPLHVSALPVIETKKVPTLLERSIAKIRSLLVSVKEQHSAMSLLLLLLFAFLYGIIHALGPGHGKTLVSSYFLGNKRSYTKAAFVSLAIGVVHTFSAFILTLGVYFMLDHLLSQVLHDVIRYTTVVSALIIIAIALWQLFKKIRAYRSQPSLRFNAAPSGGFSLLHSKAGMAHQHSCSCRACRIDNNTTDFGLIISAGIIPCPGTVTLFIFALSLGLYGVGFFAALAMSLGMSLVIFASAAFTLSLQRYSTQRFKKLAPVLEFGSLAIILVLGCVLLFL